MIGIIDGDLVTYRCGFSVEKRNKITLENGDVEHKRDIAPLSHALQNVDTLVNWLASKFDGIEVYLTGGKNWRDDFAKIEPYKGNRSPFGKPVYYKEIRDYLAEKYKATITDGVEADDAIGIRQTREKDTTCIVSYDKDMAMIPGAHYNWIKDESKYIDERDGLRNFYAQVLSGDRIDNVPGIYGIGERRAKGILKEVSSERSAWQIAQRVWHDHYPRGFESSDGRIHSVAAAIVEVASLLWIARTGRERWSPPE